MKITQRQGLILQFIKKTAASNFGMTHGYDRTRSFIRGEETALAWAPYYKS